MGTYAGVNGLELYYEMHGGGWDGAGMSDARLAVLPGTTHYDNFFSPTLAKTVAPFLDASTSGEE